MCYSFLCLLLCCGGGGARYVSRFLLLPPKSQPARPASLPSSLLYPSNLLHPSVHGTSTLSSPAPRPNEPATGQQPLAQRPSDQWAGGGFWCGYVLWTRRVTENGGDKEHGRWSSLAVVIWWSGSLFLGGKAGTGMLVSSAVHCSRRLLSLASSPLNRSHNCSLTLLCFAPRSALRIRLLPQLLKRECPS